MSIQKEPHHHAEKLRSAPGSTLSAEQRMVADYYALVLAEVEEREMQILFELTGEVRETDDKEAA